MTEKNFELMQDKNNVTMKTGDIVKIENAYFKNDNGFWFITRSPGDRSWSGRDYSLHKIGKGGKVSTAKHHLAFWPLCVFVNDRNKRYEANKHNEENATIEVIYDIDNADVVSFFESELNREIEEKNRLSRLFGEDHDVTQKQIEMVNFYRSLVERVNTKTDNTTIINNRPENPAEAKPEAKPEAEPSETKYYGVSEETAERAWYAVHMGDYKKNSATSEYKTSVDNAAEIAKAQKQKVSSFYHDKIDHLLDSYAYKLAKWYNDYNRNEASCPSWFICGPANYPVRKHEKKMNRERALWEEYHEIEGIINKIKSVGTGPIDFADPHAREMLQERIENLQKELDRDKALNAYWKKHKSFWGCPVISAHLAEKLTESTKDLLDRCPWITKPFPDYELTSLRDKIKRATERLEEYDKRQAAQESGETNNTKFEGGEIVRNITIDRLQIIFDDIPSAETRSALKSNGFRWSPRYKAWQRQLTDNAERALKQLGLLA